MKPNSHEEHFVVCLDNTGYEASLELGKLYRFVPDEQATGHGYIQVIDESGDDYAYEHPLCFYPTAREGSHDAFGEQTVPTPSGGLKAVSTDDKRNHPDSI